MNIQLFHIAIFLKYYLLNGARFRTNYIDCHLVGKKTKSIISMLIISAMTLLDTSELQDLSIIPKKKKKKKRLSAVTLSVSI
jgi:hypothetical protein